MLLARSRKFPFSQLGAIRQRSILCTPFSNLFTHTTKQTNNVQTSLNATQPIPVGYPINSLTNRLDSMINGITNKRNYCSTTTLYPIDKIRNFAIIAHVDHGKTTLVDKILRESGTLDIQDGERLMDSDSLEQERGITIMAKNTTLHWSGYKFNIVDTPGHSDFGGEVERILTMVDGVILLVDVVEGPMTQTKFVLSKALKKNLPAIVVLNKMDRDMSNKAKVESDIFDLFVELGASEDQLTYPTLFASAKAGWVINDLEKNRAGMKDLLDAIIETIPPPKGVRDAPFKMLITTLDYDDHLGKLLVGRVTDGMVKPGDRIKALSRDDKLICEATVTKLLAKHGLQNHIIDFGAAGDIVSVAGFNNVSVSSTLCDINETKALEADAIDPPVLSMTFGVNNSPLSGKEGKIFSALHIRERLDKEAARNVTVTISNSGERADEFIVSGRGELQLSILIENMRREGFELSISPPQVILQTGPNGQLMEPREEVIIDVDNEFCGLALDMMRMRDAELLGMHQSETKTRANFLATSRSLIGLRSELTNATRGSGIFNHIFYDYVPYRGRTAQIRKGVIVSMADGVATGHALKSVENRGVLFIGPQSKIYEGMIIGENAKQGDLEVNPVREKQLTNVRAVSKDDFFRLTPPRNLSLEEAIAYIQEDELIEVTPKSVRLRKKILDTAQRERARKQAKKE